MSSMCERVFLCSIAFRIQEKRQSNGPISFENRVRTLAKNSSYDAKMVENVICASKMIKKQISELVPKTIPSRLMKNTIWFERYQPDYREFNVSINIGLQILVMKYENTIIRVTLTDEHSRGKSGWSMDQ